MANLGSDGLDKVNTTAQDIQKRAQSAEKSLDKISRNAGEKIGAVASGITNSASEYIRTSSQYVRDNPVRGVAVAAAAGVIAGSLLTIAMRRRQ
jgi:ElaB/YqjD/DUF883 family membrane-anchored ribosome-binding protein